MATKQLSALDAIEDAQKKTLEEQYGGRMSNQFVEELKSSTMFQFSWSELLSAAPTALSLMGSLWIAASNPKAYRIDLKDSVPQGGFKFITKRSDPKLRDCLVDVCATGGNEAFNKASMNMDALFNISRRIYSERITNVFSLLGDCTESGRALEDFNDALADFAKDASTCAKLATEIREAFTKWGNMVGELHATTEHQKGKVVSKEEETQTQEQMALIEKKFAGEAAKEVKTQVEKATKQLEKAEQRLDKSIENVPGPWATVAQGAIMGYTQAMPHILAAALPAVLTMANPGAALASGVLGQLKQQPTSTSQTQAQPQQTAAPAAAPTITDPSYAAAVTIRELANHFYEYLGGEKGAIDWSKWTSAPTVLADGTTAAPTSGVTYIIGNLQGQKAKVDVTNTEANKKLMASFDKMIGVAKAIQQFQKNETNLNEAKLEDATLASWKADAKQAQADIIQLAAAGGATSSSATPNAFGQMDINLPKTDTSAQTAQLNGAMQGVQIAQTAADNAQANFDAAIERQAKMAAALAEVEIKLKRLKEDGQTLAEIKAVLRDCVSVLVDLCIQIQRLEKFFTMLTTIIDSVVLSRADTFTKEMGKFGKRALEDRAIEITDVVKQTIYMSTLQLKAYFSLLADISEMYLLVDRKYILPGKELCLKLSKGSEKNSMPELQEELSKYTSESAQAVAKLVEEKQTAILNGLKARAKMAAEGTRKLEDTIARKGLPVDSSAKKAIAQGAELAKDQAKEMLDAAPPSAVEATKKARKNAALI